MPTLVDLDRELARLELQLRGWTPNPLPWPISEAGFKALERALVLALQRKWNQSTEEALATLDRRMDDLLLKHGNNLSLVHDEVSEELADILGRELAEDPELVETVAAAVADSELFGKVQAELQLHRDYPRSSAPDPKAVEWLRNDTMFWIRENYDRQLGSTLADLSRKVGLEQGLGRRELGRALLTAYDRRFKSHAYYWEVVGSAAVSRGRHAGQVLTYSELGVETWTWNAAMDERTCEVCMRLDGQVFSVAQSVSRLDSLMSAKNPEAAKEQAPWINWDPKREWTDNGRPVRGSAYYKLPSTGNERHYLDAKLTDGKHLQDKGLGDGGQAHGGCRCFKTYGGEMGARPYPVEIHSGGERESGEKPGREPDGSPVDVITAEKHESPWLGQYRDPTTIPKQEDRIRRLLDNWVQDTQKKESIEIAIAARLEFNLKGVVYNQYNYEITEGAILQSRKDLRAIYNETQRELKNLKLDVIDGLYRGVKEQVGTNALESWTSELRKAEEYSTKADGSIGKIIGPLSFKSEKVLIWHGMSKWKPGERGQEWEYIIMDSVI